MPTYTYDNFLRRNQEQSLMICFAISTAFMFGVYIMSPLHRLQLCTIDSTGNEKKLPSPAYFVFYDLALTGLLSACWHSWAKVFDLCSPRIEIYDDSDLETGFEPKQKNRP